MNFKTKYKVGDTVWFMHKNKIVSDTIRLMSLIINNNEKKQSCELCFETIRYDENSREFTRYDYNVYSSKDELIKTIS